MIAKNNAGHPRRTPFSLHFVRQVSKKRRNYISYNEDRFLVDHRASATKGLVQSLKNRVHIPPNEGSFRRFIVWA